MRGACRIACASAMLVAILACLPRAAFAVEGAVGRSITGAQILPNAGVVPPTPGWVTALVAAWYDGRLDASKEIPLGGETVLGMEGKISLPAISLIRIWDTGPGHWNYASGIIIPYVFADVDVNARVNTLQAATSDSVSDFFDLGFVPIQASYHISKTEHVSLGLTVYAPTAKYTKGKLANPGLNVWTISPAVSYTNYVGSSHLELSGIWGLDFYTKNDDTGYTNGVVSRLDLLALQRLPNGFGFGAVAGWLEQITDDKGSTADRLNGFRGRSLGIGPLVSYTTKLGTSHFEMTLRWVREFNVKNRLEGDVVVLSGTLAF